MRFGAHMSIGGGFPLAVERAVEAGCDALQIFTKNASQWRARPLDDGEARAFRDAWKAAGLAPPIGHDSYLVNLASPDRALWERSIEAFAEEMDRGESLGLACLVTHPGSHMGQGVGEGIVRVAAALDRLLDARPDGKLLIALENTAGQGSGLGRRFEELGAIIGRVRGRDRLGVCLDTCHAFAAGYDLGTRSGVAETLRAFDGSVGLERLVAVHVNDSLRERGSGVDRHAHIGEGKIGLAGFHHLLHRRALRRLPMILETPKEGDSDLRNLAVLRALAATPDMEAGLRAASLALSRWRGRDATARCARVRPEKGRGRPRPRRAPR
jgi:deoxyribonuclease-4